MDSQLTYFKPTSQNAYEYSQFRVGMVIFGVILFLIAAGLLYVDLVISQLPDTDFVVYVIIAFLVILGLWLILKSKTKVIIDKANNTVSSNSGFLKKSKDLDKFHNFEIIKHYYNGAYTGTEIKMLFDYPNKKNYKALSLTRMRKDKKIEAFVSEVEYILQS